jgi:abortive infection bacteriophage resistance protein
MTNQNTFRFFSPEDRVQNLIDRGLEIEDRRFASESIAWMGDQRLKHYWSYFMDYSIPGTHPRFKPGHNFDEIINLYHMDRELRFLLTRPLEVFEINLRNAIVKVLNESGFSYKWMIMDF